MSLESQMQGVIKNRRNNFYDRFDEVIQQMLEEDPTLDPDHMFRDDRDETSYGFLTAKEVKKVNERHAEKGLPLIAQSSEAALLEKIYNARKNKIRATEITIEANSSIYYTNDESSEFFGYSYDEIIGMANNGIRIPDEVLEWAYSMVDANSTEQTPETEGASAHDLYETLKNNPFLNIKTITKIFISKCKDESEILEEYLDELTPLVKQMEFARLEVETKKEESLESVKSLSKEWKGLQDKVKGGEELSTEEKARLAEIEDLIGEEDKNYQHGIKDSTRDFNETKIKMGITGEQAETVLDFGLETVEVSQELAEFEKRNKSGSFLFGCIIGGGIAGVLSANAIFGVKRFSQIAFTIGMDTQNFSMETTDLLEQVTLLMQDTAKVAGFDYDDLSQTVTTLTADESIDMPELVQTIAQKNKDDEFKEEDDDGEKEAVENEDSDAPVADITGSVPSTEDAGEAEDQAESDAQNNEEEEEINEEQLLANGEESLEDVDATTLSLPELKQLIFAEGEDSAKNGQDALKLVAKLKEQQGEVEDLQKKADDDGKTADDAKASDENDEEVKADQKTGKTDEAEAQAESSQEDVNDAAEDANLTVEDLKEKFKGYKKTNKKYTKDVDYSDEYMTAGIIKGTMSTTAGTTLSVIGTTNIITGNTLLSNLFTMPLGMALIYKGSMELSLGTAMIDSGIALTVSAAEGLEINKDADGKIDGSNDNISTATEQLKEIDAEQNDGEVDEESYKDNEEEELNDEEAAREADKKLLEDMGIKDTAISQLIPVMHQEGKESAILGAENVKKTKELEPKIPAITEEAIAIARAKREAEKKGEEYKGAEGGLYMVSSGGSSTSGTSEAPTESGKEAAMAEDASEAGGAGAAGEAGGEGGIEGQEEALEDKKEQQKTIFQAYKEDFAKDKSINDSHKKDIASTDVENDEGLKLSDLGENKGTKRTVFGAGEIAEGAFLMSHWWSISSIRKGLHLIKLGKADTALGMSMIGSGMDLNDTSTFSLINDAIASYKIAESDEKTNESNDQINEWEAQVDQAVEEQIEADKKEEEQKGEGEDAEKGPGEDGLPEAPTETEYAEEDVYVPEYTEYTVRMGILTSYEDGSPDIEQDEKAEDKVDKAEEKQSKEETKSQKQERKEKKQEKKANVQEKEYEQTDKETEKSLEKSEEETEKGDDSINEGESTNADAQNSSDEATEAQGILDSQANELESISAEVDSLVSETNDIVDDAKDEIDNNTAENESIVEEMTQATDELKQDQNQMNDLGNQIKQEESKSKSDGNKDPKPTPEPKPEPQPQPQPKPKKAQKPEPEEEPKQEEIQEEQTTGAENSPAPAPLQANGTSQTEDEGNEKPEGSDKIEFSSDKEKEPDFVGFVAQSDSMSAGTNVTPNSKSNDKKSTGTSSGSLLANINRDGNNNKPQNKKKSGGKKASVLKPQGVTSGKKQENDDEEKEDPLFVAAQRSNNDKAFDISSMAEPEATNGPGNTKVRKLRTTMQAISTAAFNKQARLNAMYIRANDHAMENIYKEAQAEAAAARQERLAREKQERIDKIKQYASYGQMLGGLTTTVGQIVSHYGKVAMAAGQGTVTAGTEAVTTATANIATATGQIATGTATIATGGVQITLGTTQEAIGVGEEVAGGTVIAAGTATTTAGETTIIATSPLLTFPTTPAGVSGQVAGGVTVAAGTATIASGTALEAAGGVLEAFGITTQGTGVASVESGTITVETGTVNVTTSTSQLTLGMEQILQGGAQIASGAALEAAGDVVQVVGNCLTAASAIVSGSADIANGNLLGGIASIVGAAASVVGMAAGASSLASNAMNLAGQGTGLAQQLISNNNSDDSSSDDDSDKKKKKFKKNQRTDGIIDKEQKKKQNVQNRFSK